MMNINKLLTVLAPRNIWEIGVGQPELCRTTSFMARGGIVKMFEPFYPNYKKLTESFGHLPNVDIYNIALYDSNGEIDLNQDGECSFVEGVDSPTVTYYKSRGGRDIPKVKTPCCKLSHFDYGQIDVALIDTEGCEWKVVSQMVSRPRVICLEMRMGTNSDAPYVTPEADKLEAWLKTNGYTGVPEQQDGEGDIWYFRGDVFSSIFR